jgi:hypothetical protein
MSPLTRSFKDTVQARATTDPAFREDLFKEALDLMISGDMDTGKLILRDYINATIGFEVLAQLLDKPVKSLMRMFSPRGNPQANNLFAVIAALQKAEGIYFHTQLTQIS